MSFIFTSEKQHINHQPQIMITIRITRTQTNKTASQGIMSVDGTHVKICTLEGPVRRTGKQVGAALPCGTYPATIAPELLTYQGRHVRAPWPTIKKVPWFPEAQIKTAGIPRAGRIIIGLTVSPFEADETEEAMRMLSETLQPLYDADPQQPVQLIIEHADDFTFYDFSRADIERQQRREEELRQREQESRGWGE